MGGGLGEGDGGFTSTGTGDGECDGEREGEREGDGSGGTEVGDSVKNLFTRREPTLCASSRSATKPVMVSFARPRETLVLYVSNPQSTPITLTHTVSSTPHSQLTDNEGESSAGDSGVEEVAGVVMAAGS